MQNKPERFRSISSCRHKAPISATPDDYYDYTKEVQLRGSLGKCRGVLHILKGDKNFKLTFYGYGGTAIKLNSVTLMKLQEGLQSKVVVTNVAKFRINNTQPLEVLLRGLGLPQDAFLLDFVEAAEKDGCW